MPDTILTIPKYLEAREKAIITTLLYGSRTGGEVPSAVACKALSGVQDGAWSPAYEAMRVRMLRAAEAGRSMLAALQADPLHVDRLKIPRAAVGVLTPTKLHAEIDEINQRRYVPLARDNFAALQQAFAEQTGTDALETLLKMATRLTATLSDVANGNTIEEVNAFEGDRLRAAYQGYTGVKYPTGLPNLDELFAVGGLKVGDLMMISSGAKGAKTMLATTLAANFALAQIPVLYISMEIEAIEIERRVMAKVSGIPYREIINGTYDRVASDHDKAQLEAAIEGYGLRKYIRVIDAARGLLDTARVLSYIRSAKTGIVIIDHLGLVDSSDTKDANYLFRQKLVAKIVAGVKASKQLAGIAVAQLNAEGQLSGSKSQNQGITHHLTWMLGDTERESKIARVMPMDWRDATPLANSPLYFSLDWDRQSFFPLSSTDPAVIEYLEAKGNEGKPRKPKIPANILAEADL